MNLYSLLQASAGAGKPVRVGLLDGTRPVSKGAVLCWDDVAIDTADPTVQSRREMEAAFISLSTL